MTGITDPSCRTNRAHKTDDLTDPSAKDEHTPVDEEQGAIGDLEGHMRPATTGGVIRYRLWPIKRRPGRTVLVALVILALTWATWHQLGSELWAVVVLIGTTAGAGMLFVPTEVMLDGYHLNMRAMNLARTWDLRHFRKLEVNGGVLPRVDLTGRLKRKLLDQFRVVQLPLPSDAEDAELVLAHVRRWVGRSPTGKFELDRDHAPEDNVS
jgi:hypothetical protein